MQCRESKGLGYRKYQCPVHKEVTRVVPYTCKTRICTVCAALQNDIWAEELKQRFPKEKSLHIVFTMPEQFREFFGTREDPDWKRKNELYQIAWKALRGFFKSKNLLSGCIMTLHTYGRALNINPHIHIVAPAGGLRLKNENYTWENLSYVPDDYLSAIWTRHLLEYVISETSYFRSNAEEMIYLLQRKDFSVKEYKKFMQRVFELVPESDHEKWMNILNIPYYYVKTKTRESTQQPACYIARYARKLPIAKSRILDWDPKTQMVTWEYKSHKDHSTVKTTVHVQTFIRQLIRHIPPANFRMVRYYGIFSSRDISKYHEILVKAGCPFENPNRILSWRERLLLYSGKDPLICPCCQKELVCIETATPDTASGGLRIKMLTKLKCLPARPLYPDSCFFPKTSYSRSHFSLVLKNHHNSVLQQSFPSSSMCISCLLKFRY